MALAEDVRERTTERAKRAASGTPPPAFREPAILSRELIEIGELDQDSGNRYPAAPLQSGRACDVRPDQDPGRRFAGGLGRAAAGKLPLSREIAGTGGLARRVEMRSRDLIT
jgi:hypothetical protein